MHHLLVRFRFPGFRFPVFVFLVSCLGFLFGGEFRVLGFRVSCFGVRRRDLGARFSVSGFRFPFFGFRFLVLGVSGFEKDLWTLVLLVSRVRDLLLRVRFPVFGFWFPVSGSRFPVFGFRCSVFGGFGVSEFRAGGGSKEKEPRGPRASRQSCARSPSSHPRAAPPATRV